MGSVHLHLAAVTGDLLLFRREGENRPSVQMLRGSLVAMRAGTASESLVDLTSWQDLRMLDALLLFVYHPHCG